MTMCPSQSDVSKVIYSFPVFQKGSAGMARLINFGSFFFGFPQVISLCQNFSYG